jgi:RNA polymerase sigma-70 factor (ECF subfamily)
MPTADDGSLWAAFEAEALPHAARLFRFAMWLERDRAEAEDLVQETLTQALQSFHRFEPGTNCKAWLMTILQHIRSNRLRARGRRPIAADVDGLVDVLAFEPSVPDRITDEEVLDALRAIPQPYQDVILLCDVEGLTYREAALALSIPIGTVMSRLHRGRAQLRSGLSHLGRFAERAAAGLRGTP